MWRHMAAALIALLAAMPAQGQRRLFASEGDGPGRSWVIDGMTADAARAAIGESRAGRAEGIWQATADGALVALIGGDAPGLWRDAADSDGYSATRRLLMVIVDSPRPGLRPGTVMGWASPAATPGKWDARIFTRTDGRELHTPRRFTLTLADDNHITLGEGGVDATWAYISPKTVANDSALVEQARQNLKYQLYTFANSAIMNVSTERVDTWWDVALRNAQYISGALCAVTAAAWVVLTVLPDKKKEV